MLTEVLSLAQQTFYLLSHLPSPFLITIAICEGTGTPKPPLSNAALCCLVCLPLFTVLHSSSVSLWKVLVMATLCLALYPFQSKLTQLLSSYSGQTSPSPHPSSSCGSICLYPLYCQPNPCLCSCSFSDCQDSFRFMENL